MGRKILFITTDQMRFDALGVNGQKIARTPAIDALARDGINYTRCHAQNVVCMPARATMITGQYVSTHGVWMNGVPLPVDAPSVARLLKEKKNYRTALIGKAHFEPFLDLQLQFEENRMGVQGTFGPHRGFDHMELAAHGARGPLHYPRWLMQSHPDVMDMFYPVLGPNFTQNSYGEGDTKAIQTKHNQCPRELYHTDWDMHGGSLDLGKPLDNICKEVDQPSAALVKDLKRLGLLDSTIVIWGGEFGRTPMGEKRETVGRDHHIDAYTMWLAGGGFKPGLIHGTTDDLGYSVTENPVHVHDLQATVLHQLGIDHLKLTYRFQGRDYRLTDVHGNVVKEILV